VQSCYKAPRNSLTTALFAVSLSDLLIKPSHSITKQSYSCRERFSDGLSGLPPALNADGFGLAWYDTHAPVGDAQSIMPGTDTTRMRAPLPSVLVSPTDHPMPVSGLKRPRAETAVTAASHKPTDALQSWEKPGVYTSTNPAWNDVNLPRLCDKLSSRLVFAHVRAASLGTGVHLMNCHPFASSRYMFMHNGHIGGFAQLRRRMLVHLSDRALAAIRGTTDSEHLFGVFLTEVERVEAYPHAVLTPQQLQDALIRAMCLVEAWRGEAGITESSLLNLCVSDGRTVLATRVVLGTGKAASLYFTSGSRWAPRDASKAAETPAGIDYSMQQTDRREHAVIIASERLTSCEDDWLPVPKDHMLIVHPSIAVLRVPVIINPALVATLTHAPTLGKGVGKRMAGDRSFFTVEQDGVHGCSGRNSASTIGAASESSEMTGSTTFSSTFMHPVLHDKPVPTPPPMFVARGTDGIYLRPSPLLSSPLQTSPLSAARSSDETLRPQMSCAGRDIASHPMHLGESSCNATTPVLHACNPRLALLAPPPLHPHEHERVMEYDGGSKTQVTYEKHRHASMEHVECCGTVLPQADITDFIPSATISLPSSAFTIGDAQVIEPELSAAAEATASSSLSIRDPASLTSDKWPLRPPMLPQPSPGTSILSHDEDTFGNNTPSVWRPHLAADRTVTTT
jgi:glutamine amidotransferase